MGEYLFLLFCLVIVKDQNQIIRRKVHSRWFTGVPISQLHYFLVILFNYLLHSVKLGQHDVATKIGHYAIMNLGKSERRETLSAVTMGQHELT